MAVKKTYTEVTEKDAKAALDEQLKLRQEEGKKIDAARKEQEEKVSKTEVVKP